MFRNWTYVQVALCNNGEAWPLEITEQPIGLPISVFATKIYTQNSARVTLKIELLFSHSKQTRGLYSGLRGLTHSVLPQSPSSFPFKFSSSHNSTYRS